MFWARLGLRRKGLKSSGANQYPINTKLTPRFLVFLRRPVVLALINLYMTAEEKAIRIDLTLMSPKVKIFSSLNLVMSLDSLTSMSSNDWIWVLTAFRYEAYFNGKKYDALFAEIAGYLFPIDQRLTYDGLLRLWYGFNDCGLSWNFNLNFVCWFNRDSHSWLYLWGLCTWRVGLE